MYVCDKKICFDHRNGAKFRTKVRINTDRTPKNRIFECLELSNSEH